MNATKTHTVIVRGISKSDKNALKSKAKLNRLSLNSLMLHAIDAYLDKFPKQAIGSIN